MEPIAIQNTTQITINNYKKDITDIDDINEQLKREISKQLRGDLL
jgi:hypothetical protein